jgi:hypothetical protein
VRSLRPESLSVRESPSALIERRSASAGRAAWWRQESGRHGEFDIFAKAGAARVFHADTLIGPRLPSLTYMLSFPDIAALAAREKFGADPDWKKLSNDPRFKLDPPTVSNVISIVLRPLPYVTVAALLWDVYSRDAPLRSGPGSPGPPLSGGLLPSRGEAKTGGSIQE